VTTDFSFKLPDLEALDVLRGQSLFWVQNAFNRQLQDEMAAALDEYFSHGKTRIELAKRLEEFLTKKEPKMQGYFDLLADHNATRIAEIGHVTGYERAGIEYAEIVAVLDDRTSPVCRHLHGRLIPMDALSAQKNKMLTAAKSLDTNAYKKAQPMLSGASEAMVVLEPKTSKIVAQGIGMPPYHFRCRTTTVAYFEPADLWERASHWAIDGEIPKDDQPRLIDYARNARWGTHKQVWEKAAGGDGKEHPTSFVHFKKHASQVNAATMEEYNQHMMSLIRRAGRDVYLTIEDKEYPYPQLVFYDAQTKEMAVINLKGQQIATYYIKNKEDFEAQLKKGRYEVITPLEDAKKINKAEIIEALRNKARELRMSAWDVARVSKTRVSGETIEKIFSGNYQGHLWFIDDVLESVKAYEKEYKTKTAGMDKLHIYIMEHIELYNQLDQCAFLQHIAGWAGTFWIENDLEPWERMVEDDELTLLSAFEFLSPELPPEQVKLLDGWIAKYAGWRDRGIFFERYRESWGRNFTWEQERLDAEEELGRLIPRSHWWFWPPEKARPQ
jgi:SPP1 gp7 family putative phage head morphogenesis protein